MAQHTKTGVHLSVQVHCTRKNNSKQGAQNNRIMVGINASANGNHDNEDAGENEEPNNREKSDQSRSDSMSLQRGHQADADDHDSPFRGRDHEQRSHSSRTGGTQTSRRRRHRHDWRQRNRRHRSPFRGGDDRWLRHERDNDRNRRDAMGDGGAQSRGGQHEQERDDSDTSGYYTSCQSSEDDSRSRSRSREHSRSRNHRRGYVETEDTETPKTAMSYRKAPQVQKKNVADRIQVLVKGTIFRKLKFITSEEMFNKAMKIVIETEEPNDEDEFIRIYKTCVVGGINAKRSTCEQAGARIVKELLTKQGYIEGDNNPPYSIHSLVQLRQGVTVIDKEAFLWFIGEFVACVSGTKVWGRKKYYYRVSEAVIDKGSQELVVTVSDEAFAILLYENYIDKWIARYHMERRGEKPGGKSKGKYTSSVTDHCLYGGWSAEGVTRFNALCAIVDKDRKSADAKKAEDAVLLALRRRKFGDCVDDGNLIDPQEERQQRRVMPEAVEAFCEL